MFARTTKSFVVGPISLAVSLWSGVWTTMASNSGLTEDRITVHMTGGPVSQTATRWPRLSHAVVGSWWKRESADEAPSSDILALNRCCSLQGLARPSPASQPSQFG